MDLFIDYYIVFNILLLAGIAWNRIELMVCSCVQLQLDDWAAEIEAIKVSALVLDVYMTKQQYKDHEKALMDCPNKFGFHDKLVNFGAN